MAVEDDLTLSGFSVGQLSDNPKAIVAGHDLDLANGMAHGDVCYGNDATLTPNATITGALSQASPIDFDACHDQICDASEQMATVWANGDAMWSGATLALTGDDPMVNVFALTAWELSGASMVWIDVPAGSTVIINVSGTPLTLSGFAIVSTTDLTGKLVINAPEATHITINSFNLPGSLLACGADIDFNNGQINGTVVGANLSGNGELHHHPFTGQLVLP
ncbi:MAG: choice-of-anchor A domain-containing protein [Myxococcota bacterium]